MPFDEFFDAKAPIQTMRTCIKCKKNRHPTKYKQCWSCYNVHNPINLKKLLREKISKTSYREAEALEHQSSEGLVLLYYKTIKNCLCFFISLKGTKEIHFSNDPRVFFFWDSKKCTCTPSDAQHLVLRELGYLRKFEIEYRLSFHTTMHPSFPFENVSIRVETRGDGKYDFIEIL